MRTSLFMLFAAFALVSCDCKKSAEGTVVDAVTGLPLDSVTVSSYYAEITKENRTDQMITDSTGYFFGSNTAKNKAANCDLYITFVKEGYISIQLHNPKNNREVKLERDR